MKRRFLFVVALGLALCLTGAPAWGDDFYVIAGGGPSGKVLKTQVFTSNISNNTLGTGSWGKLGSPQWTYTKLSATSYLVITYQDSIWCSSLNKAGTTVYQLRVNDLVSVAGEAAALLYAHDDMNICGATGVWTGLPKGDVNLSIWHRQWNCTACQQNEGQNVGPWTTNVLVMEIEH